MEQSSVRAVPEFCRNRSSYSGQYPVNGLGLHPWNTLVLSTRYSRRQWQRGRSIRTLSQRREALHLRVLGSVPLAFNIYGYGSCQTQSNTLIAMLPMDRIPMLLMVS
jgi:hypothetical protein